MRALSLHGKPVTEGVREIVWTGSLADDHFDEFVFLARITDAVPAGTDLAFPVVQTCATGTEAWTEIAAPGQDAHALKKPAPTVKIVARDGCAEGVYGRRHHRRAALVPGHACRRQGRRRLSARHQYGPGARSPDRRHLPLAGQVELHEMSMTDNVMRMKQVEGGLEIKPGETRGIEARRLPSDVRRSARRSERRTTIKGTLVFEKAGTVEVEYGFAPCRARRPCGRPTHH